MLEDWISTLIHEDHFFMRFGNSIGLLYFLFVLLVLFLISLRKIGWQLFKILYFIFCCNQKDSKL